MCLETRFSSDFPVFIRSQVGPHWIKAGQLLTFMSQSNPHRNVPSRYGVWLAKSYPWPWVSAPHDKPNRVKPCTSTSAVVRNYLKQTYQREGSFDIL